MMTASVGPQHIATCAAQASSQTGRDVMAGFRSDTSLSLEFGSPAWTEWLEGFGRPPASGSATWPSLSGPAKSTPAMANQKLPKDSFSSHGR